MDRGRQGRITYNNHTGRSARRRGRRPGRRHSDWSCRRTLVGVRHYDSWRGSTCPLTFLVRVPPIRNARLREASRFSQNSAPHRRISNRRRPRSRSVECTRLLLKNSKPPMPLFTNAPLGPRGCGCLCASRPEGLHERPRSGDASLLQVLLQSRAPTPSRLAWARPGPCSPLPMVQDQSPGPLLPAAQLHVYERYCHRYEHYDTEAPSASRLGSMSAEIVPASIDIPPRNRGTTLTAPH